MIHVRPFRAWRPVAHAAHLVGSRSFVQYSRQELLEKLAGNPYTFLHVLYPGPEGQELPRAEHYDHVRAKFIEFIRQGTLVREARPAYYLYEQSCAAFTSRGLIGAVAVDDYLAGRIKRHEQTIEARERMFSEYLGHTAINAEPVLLAVPREAGLGPELEACMQGAPLFDFSTTDRIRHRFWKVEAPADVERYAKLFAGLPAAYIADGHHRCASSALRARQSNAPASAALSAFMAILVPADELHLYNYDRTVKGLNGLSPQQFQEAMARVGPWRDLGDERKAPGPGEVQVYINNRWFELALPGPHSGTPVELLETQRLSEHVLGPVLGITDLRADPRMGFVPGILGREALEKKVDGGKADVAFHLPAVTFAQLRAVADSGGCMPPKSTWIEPKLRSGLTIYSLEDE